MKTLLLCVVLLPSIFSFAQKTVRCYTSVGLKKNFTFWLSEEEAHKNATVQYTGQKEAIQLQLVKEAEVKRTNGGQSMFQIVFNEIVNGKVTGRYSFTTQGAIIYEASYVRSKDNKKFRLSETTNGCK